MGDELKSANCSYATRINIYAKRAIICEKKKHTERYRAMANSYTTNHSLMLFILNRRKENRQ